MKRRGIFWWHMSVSLYVCIYIQRDRETYRICNAITFRKYWPRKFILVCRYIFIGHRSSSYIEVIGWRSWSLKACLCIADLCNMKQVNLGSRWVTCSWVVAVFDRNFRKTMYLLLLHTYTQGLEWHCRKKCCKGTVQTEGLKMLFRAVRLLRSTGSVTYFASASRDELSTCGALGGRSRCRDRVLYTPCSF